MREQTRRRFLVGAGAAASVAVAGCVGDDDDGGGNGDGDGGMENGGSLADHPVGQNLDSWPQLGPDPFEAPATIVVLDDPSCPRCAAFHNDTIAELEAEYADAGDLSIVSRPYPVVYEWGEPASHALEATMDRDHDAFWELIGYYFDEQSAFEADTVLAETETWLDENTDLDASAVVDDAREEAFADRIDATIEAGEAAGAGGVTPATFAFQDGEHETSLNGSVSPVTIETVLGL